MRIIFLSNLRLFVFTALALMPIQAQLQVGDISPDFSGPLCMNGEDVNPDIVMGDYWSLFDHHG